MLSLFVFEVHAQSVNDRLHFEFATGSGLRSNGVTPMDVSFKAYVDVFRPVCLFVAAEQNNSLYKEDDVKTFYKGESLGGGLGINILGTRNSSHTLDVRLKVLSSIGNADWKRTSYDVNLAWYLKGIIFSPVVEVGYRFVDSRSDYIDNYKNAYLTLGIRY